jgi:DNA-binding NarL/FixJ family response regulator
VKVQRVLVAENQSLLGAGVENLLSRETHLDVRGISPRDETDLLEVIKLFRPDVIVLDGSLESQFSGCLLDHVTDYPKVRLVQVSLEGTLVQVYEKHQVRILHATDFLTVVQAD